MNHKLSMRSGAAAIFALALTILSIPNRATAQTETILYNFNGDGYDGSPYQPYSGVIFDSAGNLYGTTFQGGTNHGHGAVYELSPIAGGGWSETTLYSFGEKKGSEEAYGPQANLVFDNAGNLYGARSTQGADGDGMIFKLSPSGSGGWTETGIVSFNSKNGNYPESALIMDSAGNLYGTTDWGGEYGEGTVFELSPTSGGWTEKVIHNFKRSKEDGENPALGSLVMDAAGNLYGTTAGGGANEDPVCQYGCGTVFEVSPTGDGHWTEKLLYSFDDNGTDGLFPGAGVILDAAGNLYGTTIQGGTGSCKIGKEVEGCGTLFELSPAAGGTWTESILHSFQDNDTDGEYPQGGAGLTMDASGNIYGTTGLGGTYNKGTAFKFSPVEGGAWTESILHNFDDNGTDGYEPATTLVLDSSGNIYGTTAAGGNNGSGGTVYEITP